MVGGVPAAASPSQPFCLTSRMRTLGIDLATTDGTTGICEIDWASRTSTVDVGRFTDDHIAERIAATQRDRGWAAIDAPFGFPAAFSRAVHQWASAGRVPFESEHDIRRRLTDSYVAKRQAAIKSELMPGPWNPWPLSSVVDLITPSAIRCARILTAVHHGEAVDRIGLTSRVLEAYPIASLRTWNVTTKKYKTVAADCDAVLGHLCQSVEVTSPALVRPLPRGCEDDAVDAFACALIARVVALADGSTGPEAVRDYDADQLDTVRTEGWIHLPTPGHQLQELAVP